MDHKDYVSRQEVVRVLGGSRLYGLANETSDLDLRIVWFENTEDIFGLSTPKESINISTNTEDVQGWSLRHFMRLAFEGNPNIVELLFAPEDCIVSYNSAWDLLRARRHTILGWKMKKRYLGFATGEFRRLERSRTDTSYDYKAASHCARLLYQIQDILRDGDFSPRLTGSHFHVCKALKMGMILYEDAIRLIKENMETAETMETKLPLAGNYENWNDIAIEMLMNVNGLAFY